MTGANLAISSLCDRLEDRRDDINDDVDASHKNNAVVISVLKLCRVSLPGHPSRDMAVLEYVERRLCNKKRFDSCSLSQ